MKILKVLHKTSIAAIVLATGIFAATAASGPALAGLCGPHDKVVAELAARFTEQRRALGLIRSTGMVELYVSDKGTWTMLITDPRKRTCVMSMGHSWHEVQPPARPVPEASLRQPGSE